MLTYSSVSAGRKNLNSQFFILRGRIRKIEDQKDQNFKKHIQNTNKIELYPSRPSSTDWLDVSQRYRALHCERALCDNVTSRVEASDSSSLFWCFLYFMSTLNGQRVLGTENDTENFTSVKSVESVNSEHSHLGYTLHCTHLVGLGKYNIRSSSFIS